jgi:hypothetical protein
MKLGDLTRARAERIRERLSKDDNYFKSPAKEVWWGLYYYDGLKFFQFMQSRPHPTRTEQEVTINMLLHDGAGYARYKAALENWLETQPLRWWQKLIWF